MYKDVVKKIWESDVYIQWAKDTSGKKALSHVLVFYESGAYQDWQVGFTHDRLITTFALEPEIHKESSDEPFVKPGEEVSVLDIDSVVVDEQEAIKTAFKKQQKDFPAKVPKKVICILQRLSVGQLWNITFMTPTLETLNIKIDAQSGDVLTANLVSIFSFQK